MDVKLASGLGFLLGPCDKCYAREVKRVASKKRKPSPSNSSDDYEDDDEDESAIFTPARRNSRKGIVVFPKSPHLLRMQNGRVTLPVRITCYCSHHAEKLGFEYVFVLASKTFHDVDPYFIQTQIWPL